MNKKKCIKIVNQNKIMSSLRLIKTKRVHIVRTSFIGMLIWHNSQSEPNKLVFMIYKFDIVSF